MADPEQDALGAYRCSGCGLVMPAPPHRILPGAGLWWALEEEFSPDRPPTFRVWCPDCWAKREKEQGR